MFFPGGQGVWRGPTRRGWVWGCRVFKVLVIPLLLALGSRATAQSNAVCLDCHSDPDLTQKINGKEVSIAFSTNKFAASVHGTVNCIDCHTVYKKADFPHDDIKPQPVDCALCHQKEAKLEAVSLHGQAAAKGDPLAPRCQTCHGSHDILPARHPDSAVNPIRIPFVCGKCHREGTPVQEQRAIPMDRILENYTESIHGEGLLRKGLTVAASCTSCHTPHHILPHTDPRSSINPANIAATCAACHVQIEQVHRKIIQGELWEKNPRSLPVCVDCHQPHKVRKIFYENGLADKDCLACHTNPEIKSSHDGRSLHVDVSTLGASKHVKVTCAQCHTEVQASLVRACVTIKSKVNCGACHAEMAKQYQGSRHGQLFTKGEPNAPSCTECHGTHDVRGKKDEKAPIFALNIPDLCARCHRDGEKAAVRYRGPEKNITGRYRESIHGRGLYKSGLSITATCIDCHTSHGELPADDPTSSVNHSNIGHTCAKCHVGVENEFVASIHSATVSKSAKPLPVCNDCHIAHSISRTDQDDFRLTTMNRCGKCHKQIAANYFDTYHGKVSRLGYTKTAKCYDCHGAHDILPATNPASHLSATHVLATCQKCHSSAPQKFTGYLTHADHHDAKKYPWLFFTFWAMTALLVGVFAFSGLHTLLWLPRTIQMRRAHREEFLTAHQGRQFTRFSRFERLCHVVMIVTFMGLAITGLTLKFSHTGGAVFMSRFLGGFQSAGYIHRLCAFLMFLLYITHITDLFVFKRRAKGSLKNLFLGQDSLIFNKRDLQEFGASIRWFIGRGERPQYGRWTYWEKFDYFAVFWGIIIIGSTGLVLWFPEFFTHVLPGWTINVATIIHSDEALLAAGFIFTVHFFNTHLRPEKFPMDIVIFTGRMDLEELKVDKPGEYERMLQSGELEANMSERLPPVVTRVVRAFAWTALALGSGIVVWIVWALVFWR